MQPFKNSDYDERLDSDLNQRNNNLSKITEFAARKTTDQFILD
jgi:hypothetical protein